MPSGSKVAPSEADEACRAGMRVLSDAVRAVAADAGGLEHLMRVCADMAQELTGARAASVQWNGQGHHSGSITPLVRCEELVERGRRVREDTILAEPVVAGAGGPGFVAVFDKAGGESFDDLDGQALEMISAQLALAIDCVERAEADAAKLSEYRAESERSRAELELEREERRGVEEALQEANGKLTDWVYELEQRNRDTARLKEINDLMQACVSIDEAYLVVGDYVPNLFPANSGSVCVLDGTGKFLETVASWGDTNGWESVFPPERCWSLRRARPHWRDAGQAALKCLHIGGAFNDWYLCAPLMAHGQPIGLLHLNGRPRQAGTPPEYGAESGEFCAQPPGALTPYRRQLAETVAEQLGMALANLQLRDALRTQAIRDPLTGLYNRRHMEESFAREVRNAECNGSRLGCMMVDLDHFKALNDAFGHATGDMVLRQVATLLSSSVRTVDTVCRYGGEEFALILPEASLAITRQRAEGIRAKARQITIRGRNDHAPVTLSIGVAAYPEHGRNVNALLRAADAALYQAKNEGRDRVSVASPQSSPEI